MSKNLLTMMKVIFLAACCGCVVRTSLSLYDFLQQGTQTLANVSRNDDAIAADARALTETTISVIPNVNTAVLKLADTAGAAHDLLGTAGGTVARLNDSLDQVNRRCAPGPCGTLADVDKTLNTFRGTAGQVEIAANHEDRNLAQMDAQEQLFFADLHETSVNGNALIVQGVATATDAHKLADELAAPRKKLTFWSLFKRLF